MPMVRISCSDKVVANLIGNVARFMPKLVAHGLGEINNPGFELTASDVEVRVEQSPYNILHHDIEVTVMANRSPWRLENKDALAKQIAGELQKYLQGQVPDVLTGFVWLTLVDAGFSSF